jgi:microcystin-dependent protein
MADPFVAEVRMFGFNFAPTGWARCDGQLLPISQNTALFSLLGTFYGGDGKSTFALPDFAGSTVIDVGQGPGLSEYFQGQTGGEDFLTLVDSENAIHTHNFQASGRNGVERFPTDLNLAKGVNVFMYDANNQPTTTMSPQMITIAGGSLPHNNDMPFLGILFCIALQGVFPPRS